MYFKIAFKLELIVVFSELCKLGVEVIEIIIIMISFTPE